METKTLSPEATKLLARIEMKIKWLKEIIEANKGKIEANGMTYCLEWGIIESTVSCETMLCQLIPMRDQLKVHDAGEIVKHYTKTNTSKVMSRAWEGSSSLGTNIAGLIRHDSAVEFLKWLDENA